MNGVIDPTLTVEKRQECISLGERNGMERCRSSSQTVSIEMGDLDDLRYSFFICIQYIIAISLR